MNSRTGDLDPGLVYYLARTQRMTAARFQRMVNHESGLLGVSVTSSDVRDLLAREATDVRAVEAACFLLSGQEVDRRLRRRARRSGHARLRSRIGEHAPHIRERICDGLGFLGIELHPTRNAENAGDFAGRWSRHRTGHPHRRRPHDRDARHARPQSRINSEG